MDVQIAAGKRQQAESQRQQGAMYTKMCDESLASMDARRFPTQQSMKGIPAEMRGSCDTRRPEFCKKLQTEGGFSLAARHQGNLPAAGELCAVQPDKLKASLCGGALKNESIDSCRATARQK